MIMFGVKAILLANNNPFDHIRRIYRSQKILTFKIFNVLLT